VVKAFSQEEPEIESFAVVNRDYLQKAIDLAKVNACLAAMQFLLGGASRDPLGGWSGCLAARLTIGPTRPVRRLNLQIILWPGLIALGEVTNMIQQGWASLRAARAAVRSTGRRSRIRWTP